MTRRIALVVGLALILAGASPAGGVAGAVAAPGGPSGAFDRPAGALAATQQNNTTAVRHRNPATIDEPGDLSLVRTHLAGEMGEITIDCSRGIRVGNYAVCEELDGPYSDALEKYVDVTGRDQTGAGAADSFRDLQRQQQEFANETRRFRETYRAYREARRNGNTARARRLARDLLAMGETIERTGANLSRTAIRLENRTSVSLTPVVRNTRVVVGNVTNTTATVSRVLFVRTSMTATRASDGPISARDPLVVTGQVRTENGTAVRNGSVVLATGPGRGAEPVATTRVALNDSGGYRLTYRPTAVRTGPRTVDVRYQPPPASSYLPATATVEATVAEVTATLSIVSAPGTVRYREPVDPVTRVTIEQGGESVGLAGVPLAMRVDGRTLATGRTNASGATVLRAPLPAAVAPGDQRLVVTGPTSNRAVVVQPATTDLRVLSSASNLTLRAVQTAPGERRIRVVGRLRARGHGVPGRDLQVRIDGQPRTTLETDATGQYRGTVTVPEEWFPARGQRSVAVAVVYNGTGTNLGSTSQRQAVTLQSGGAGNGGPGDGGIGEGDQTGVAGIGEAISDTTRWVGSNPLLAGVVATLGLVLLVAGVVLVARRRRTAESTAGAPATAEQERTTGPSEAGATEKGDTPDPAGPVEAVRGALSEGAYTQAVLAGYTALRRELPVASQTADTHWEFYRRATEAGLADTQVDALREVTEAFEQVSFAGQAPDEETAATVLERVRAALGDGEADTGGDAAGADD